MDRIVADITEDQPGKYSRSEAAQGYGEQTPEKNRQRNANAWRHDQAGGVIWIVVMNTVNNEVQFSAPPSLRLVMKNVTMNKVLEQCPAKHSYKKEPADEKIESLLRHIAA